MGTIDGFSLSVPFLCLLSPASVFRCFFFASSGRRGALSGPFSEEEDTGESRCRFLAPPTPLQERGVSRDRSEKKKEPENQRNEKNDAVGPTIELRGASVVKARLTSLTCPPTPLWLAPPLPQSAFLSQPEIQ